MNDNLINTMNHVHDINKIMEDQRRNEHDRQARNSGRYDAEGIFEHLMGRVKQFQAGLDEKEEIGLQLANFGLSTQLHIRSIGYKNPNLVEFHGVDPNDNEATLVQHISQLNFMLIAVKPFEEEPYRIGF
jgi:hypothetical protein